MGNIFKVCSDQQIVSDGKSLHVHTVQDISIRPENKNDSILKKFGSGKKAKFVKHSFFEIDFKKLEILSCIGQGGGNAFVYKANYDGKVVAFKCFKNKAFDADDDENNLRNYGEFLKEAEAFERLKNNKNVLKMYGVCLMVPRIGIVMEYCKYGDMQTFFKNHPKCNFGVRVKMLMQVIDVLKYMHSKNYLHRDIKLENVLIDENLDAKVMDFGLSRCVERMSESKTKQIGTAPYMAPEIVSTFGNYNDKCDVYAFAMMLYVAMTDEFAPYVTLGNIKNVQFKVEQDKSTKFRPPIDLIKKRGIVPRKHQAAIRDIITRCWDYDSEVRYDARDVLRKLRVIYQTCPKVKIVEAAPLPAEKNQSEMEDDDMMEPFEVREDSKEEGTRVVIEITNNRRKINVYVKNKTIQGLREAVAKKCRLPLRDVLKVEKLAGTIMRMVTKDSTVHRLEDGQKLYVTLA